MMRDAIVFIQNRFPAMLAYNKAVGVYPVSDHSVAEALPLFRFIKCCQCKHLPLRRLDPFVCLFNLLPLLADGLAVVVVPVLVVILQKQMRRHGVGR